MVFLGFKIGFWNLWNFWDFWVDVNVVVKVWIGSRVSLVYLEIFSEFFCY